MGEKLGDGEALGQVSARFTDLCNGHCTNCRPTVEFQLKILDSCFGVVVEKCGTNLIELVEQKKAGLTFEDDDDS